LINSRLGHHPQVRHAVSVSYASSNEEQLMPRNMEPVPAVFKPARVLQPKPATVEHGPNHQFVAVYTKYALCKLK
jgi:hypothetical protein